MNSEIETKNIQAMLIVEVLGKPSEHLVETLENIIKSIGEEKGVSVKEKKIKEPTLIKDSTEFYTTFAEIEVEVEEILYLAILLFKYMPAHVEIIQPELIALTNNGWNDIFNELTRRLHGYDEIAKVLQLQNNQLKEKLQEVLEGKKPEEKTEEEGKKGHHSVYPNTLKGTRALNEGAKKEVKKKTAKRKVNKR